MNDHRFLNFTFNISKSNIGPDFWKLNTSVFYDKKYKEGIVNIAKNIDEHLPSIDRWSILSIK